MASVTAAQIALVRDGDGTAQLRFDAYPHYHRGTMRAVLSELSTAIDQTGTYEMRLAVEAISAALEDGPSNLRAAANASPMAFDPQPVFAVGIRPGVPIAGIVDGDETSVGLLHFATLRCAHGVFPRS